MTIYNNKLKFLQIFLDLFTIVVAFAVSYLIQVGIVGKYINEHIFIILLFLILSWISYSQISNLYDEFRSENFSNELILILKNIFMQSLSILIIIFLLKENTFNRLFLFYYSICLSILLITQKYSLKKVLNYYRRRGGNTRTILIVGFGEVGWKIYEMIQNNLHLGYHILGFLDDDENKKSEKKYLGKISELNNVLDNLRVDDVLVALPNSSTIKLKDIIAICEKYATKVRIIPDYYELVRLNNTYFITMFGPYPIITFNHEKLDEFYWRLVKRIFDTLFSLFVTLTLLSWLCPLIIAIIKIDSKGPAIFKQKRWGRNKRIFTTYKFRTMKINSSDFEKNGKFKQATRNDDRITKVGKILRKTNIDELPQFINVLKGEMSVVGPRPHAIPHNLELKGTIDHYMKRNLVKPGITGWAQVNGLRGETKNITLMEKRIDYDLWYIENWSVLLDIQIIIMTIWRLFKIDKNAY